MAGAIEPVGFNLVTALLSWGGALLIALVTGLVAARATVRSAQEQAIRTQLLKLRHEVAARRRAAFDEAVRQLHSASLAGNVELWLPFFPSVSFYMLCNFICRQAMLVASGEDRAALRAVVRAFRSSVAHLIELASDLRKQRGSGQQIEPWESLVRAVESMMGELHDLDYAVDWAAERRIATSLARREPERIGDYGDDLEFSDEILRGLRLTVTGECQNRGPDGEPSPCEG